MTRRGNRQVSRADASRRGCPFVDIHCDIHSAARPFPLVLHSSFTRSSRGLHATGVIHASFFSQVLLTFAHAGCHGDCRRDDGVDDGVGVLGHVANGQRGGTDERVLSINDVSGESILVDPRNATLQVGYGAIVEARILDANGNPVPDARPAWSTSDASIATVSALPDSGLRQDGLRASVAARAAGSVLIIASHANKADTARFTITPAHVDSGSQGPVTRPARFDLVARVLGISTVSQPSRDTSAWTPPLSRAPAYGFVQLPSIPATLCLRLRHRSARRP